MVTRYNVKLMQQTKLMPIKYLENVFTYRM